MNATSVLDSPASFHVNIPVVDAQVPGVLHPPVRFRDIQKYIPAEQSWVWEGYLGAGIRTMLTSLWKAGKTTLVANLLRAMFHKRPTFLEIPILPVPTLVITEETLQLWCDRLSDIPAESPLYFASRPFLGRPSPAEWKNYAVQLGFWCKQAGIKLVIVDPIANLIPGEENSAGAMLDFLGPLEALSNARAAVLLLHHPRKSDGSEGRAARGSGALPGYVDVILEMRRHPGSEYSRVRYLTSYSRYGETPPEVVLELNEDGLDYRRIASRLAAELSHMGRTILTLLGDKGEAMTVQEILAVWPMTEECPKLRSLHNLLKAGLNIYWKREGQGTRPSPYRYRALPRAELGVPPPAAEPDLVSEGAD